MLLCGDSLGLAQPLTAEGILPAVLSGRLAAEAILAGAPESYPARLAAHPVLEDYRRVFRLREAAAALGRAAERAATGRNGNGDGKANRDRASAAAPSPAASPGCSPARVSRRRVWSTRGWLLPSAGHKAFDAA